MATKLGDDVKALLDGPNFAHLATLRKDGAPQVDPVWVGREGDRILVGTGEGTVKAKNSHADSRVALSIVGFRNPYDEAMIRGRVVEWRPDPDLKVMDEISCKYIGKPFPWRSPEGRVVLVIEPLNVTAKKLPFEPPAA
jgi:PPOX class probable F420-dependent enzyme